MYSPEEVIDILNSSADIFANSSTETVTETFPPPPLLDEVISSNLLSTPLIDEIITRSNISHRKCCPFCLFDYSFDYTLKEHIKESHPYELKAVFNSKRGELIFNHCPFCDSKFYYTELVSKHVMRKHELCVINMFSGFSPDKYAYCRFCPHKVLRKHYKLLIIHIEKKHFQLFEKYIFEKYLNIHQRIEDEVIYASPGLSDDLLKLTTNDLKSNQLRSNKSILKARTAYPIEDVETVDDIMLNTEVSVLYANLEVKPHNKKVRRRLRFNLPDSPGSEAESKENVTSPIKRKKNSGKIKKLKQFLKIKKLKGTDDISPDAKALSHYKCGICSEEFDRNAKLVEHVKKKHKRISFQAQFCCGDCDAKFYKNSVLLRHSHHHHSPLCLKSSQRTLDAPNKF